jgi:hypothetical protein
MVELLYNSFLYQEFADHLGNKLSSIVIADSKFGYLIFQNKQRKKHQHILHREKEFQHVCQGLSVIHVNDREQQHISIGTMDMNKLDVHTHVFQWCVHCDLSVANEFSGCLHLAYFTAKERVMFFH